MLIKYFATKKKKKKKKTSIKALQKQKGPKE